MALAAASVAIPIPPTAPIPASPRLKPSFDETCTTCTGGGGGPDVLGGM